MDIIHHHFKCLTSTNDWIKQNLAKLDKTKITLISTKKQTAGRGRLNRSWHSPAEGNIYASFYLPISKKEFNPLNIPQILAIAAIKTLEDKGFKIEMKWPNDLILKNKKIAGILCETSRGPSTIDIIIGIGININMKMEDIIKINQPATSLKIESAQSWDEDEILEKLKFNFNGYLAIFLKQGLSPLLPILEQKLAQKGKIVNFNDGQKQIKGKIHSLNKDGSLNLELSNGSVRSFYNGEIPYL